MNDDKSARSYLKKAKRIVVKVGSSTVTHESGGLNIPVLASLAFQISELRTTGKEVILVSSGAVAAGRGKIGQSNLHSHQRADDAVTEKQVMSAIGQACLMQTYENLFGHYDATIAQILLTRDDFESPKRTAIFAKVLNELCRRDIIPIINENDAVSFDEIKLGDNDTLSARVAVVGKADALILLTDTDGLYDKDPRKSSDAVLISTVQEIDKNISGMAQGAGTAVGTGGMMTKIWAAQMATSNGIPTIIANGSSPQSLLLIMSGEQCGTYFCASSKDKTQEVAVL
jgi:glutamate 5-kinase